MSAKWSVQPVKGSVADADVLLIIDSEAGPVDNKQVLFSTLKLAAQSAWLGDIDAATFNLDNLGSVDLNNALGTNPIISALQSASESTVVLGSNFQVSSGYVDMAEIATPANPTTDVGRLYVKDNGGGITNLFFRDSAGTETDLVTGGGGGSIPTPSTSWNSATINAPQGNAFHDPFMREYSISGKQDLSTQLPALADTTLHGFQIDARQQNNLDDTAVWVLRINGIDTGMTCTVPTSSNSVVDSVGAPIDILQGELISFSVNSAATTGSLDFVMYSWWG